MKHLSTLLFLIHTIAYAYEPIGAFVNKAVFGADDRREVIEVHDVNQRLWAKSTASLVPASYMKWAWKGKKIEAQTLVERGAWLGDGWGYGSFCPFEPFANQMVGAFCSGFLIAPDLLMTAAHCIATEDMSTPDPHVIENYRWVFDFNTPQEKLGQELRSITVPERNIYRAKKILAFNYEYDEEWQTSNDYAIIQLAKNVTDRTPFQLSETETPILGTPLVTIGNPQGLTTKISAGGFVVGEEYPHFFTANLDAFHGNSGGPVINPQTGKVEGILVRGGQAFDLSFPKNCFFIRERGMDELRFKYLSGVHKINAIPELNNLF